MKANNANKVMVTREFGYPIYIAPLKDGQIQITDKIEEAVKWGDRDGEHKLDYQRIVTGYKGLTFESINI